MELIHISLSRGSQSSAIPSTIASAHPEELRNLQRGKSLWRAITLAVLCVSTWTAFSGPLPFGLNSGAGSGLSYLVTALACFSLNVLSAAMYLARRRPQAELMAGAAARVGVTFCALSVLAEALVAHERSGLWWIWNLESAMSCFVGLMYLGYILLQSTSDPGRNGLPASVLAILSFVNLPFLFAAAKLHLGRTSAQSAISPTQSIGIPESAALLGRFLVVMMLAALAVCSLFRTLVIEMKLREGRALAQGHSRFD